MTRTYILAVAALLALAEAAPPQASAAQSASPPVLSARATTEKECGACHMAFPPMFLPKQSWQALMAGLDNHFGENASLDPATSRRVAEYLTANAADAPADGRHYLEDVSGGSPTLRITETRWWIREHNKKLPPGAFASAKVKSPSNCLACHTGGARGQWDIEGEGDGERGEAGDRD